MKACVSLFAGLTKTDVPRRLYVVTEETEERPIKVIKWTHEPPIDEIPEGAIFAGTYDITVKAYNRIVKDATAREVLFYAD